MDLSREDLARAVADGLLTAAQAEALWAALAARAPAAPASPAAPPAAAAHAPRLDAVHFAWYGGALLVIGAMGWFMTEGWERLGGGGILLVSLLYAGAFLAAGRALWRREGLRTPGGLLVTMAVAMTPLATYGLQRALGVWPGHDPGDYAGFHVWIAGGWFAMEVATVAAALLALRWFRFPFLTAVVAFTLWYMSMDLAPLLGASWNGRCLTSIGVGALTLLAGLAVDRLAREDFAFWLYLFGMLALWGGLTAFEGGSALGRLVYCLLNVGFMALSLLLRRRVFMVFGAFGVAGYLGWLAHDVFRDSLLFPAVLSLIGVAVIALGVHLHRHGARYQAALERAVPARLRGMLPPPRG